MPKLVTCSSHFSCYVIHSNIFTPLFHFNVYPIFLHHHTSLPVLVLNPEMPIKSFTCTYRVKNRIGPGLVPGRAWPGSNRLRVKFPGFSANCSAPGSE